MLRSRYEYEDKKMECGIDEAGRGSFWGPLMAGAVIWPHEDDWTDAHREVSPRLKDSKKVTPKRRAVLDEEIRRLAIGWGIGTVTAQEIDACGVSWANQNAFIRAAVAATATVETGVAEPIRFLVDGILSMPAVDNYPEPDSEYMTITDGDATYMSIAAASIIAKEAHDRWIRDYCEAYPELDEKYSLLSCKGYGTAKHRAGISEHGLHELHRRRFVHGAARRGERGLPVRLVDAECLVSIPSASTTT
jgi:ribonuclease HII